MTNSLECEKPYCTRHLNVSQDSYYWNFYLKSPPPSRNKSQKTLWDIAINGSGPKWFWEEKCDVPQARFVIILVITMFHIIKGKENKQAYKLEYPWCHNPIIKNTHLFAAFSDDIPLIIWPKPNCNFTNWFPNVYSSS